MVAGAWQVGVGSAVIGYFLAYGLSQLVVTLGPIAPHYAKMSGGTKADWHSRVPSTVHAIVVFLGCLYPALQSSAHTDNRVLHYDDRLWVEYGTGLGPEFFCGLFIGYLSVDFCICFYWRETMKGVTLTLLHHVFATLAWSLAIYMRCCQWHMCFWLLAEMSTPLVNARFMLAECKAAKTTAYLINGSSMFVVFFVVRVMPLPWLLYNFAMYDATQIYGVGGPAYTVWFTFTLIVHTSLQTYWFGLMAKGVLKLLGYIKKTEKKAA